jgi:hypothetical protein
MAKEIRRPLFALLLASAGMDGLATSASAQEYPVCRSRGGDENARCDYANFDQCRAAVAGMAGSCVANPAYIPRANTSTGNRDPGRRRR